MGHWPQGEGPLGGMVPTPGLPQAVRAHFGVARRTWSPHEHREQVNTLIPMQMSSPPALKTQQL